VGLPPRYPLAIDVIKKVKLKTANIDDLLAILCIDTAKIKCAKIR